MTCAHDACTCDVTDVDLHCGPSCRMGIADPAGDDCMCGHAACTATTGEGKPA